MSRVDKKKMRKSSVRIGAGKLARRELAFYEIDGLRPTSARIRETLFNWLMAEIGGATCLDLFAGSGALGFESISRGASEVVFIEKNKKMADLIAMQIDKFNLSNAKVYATDYQNYLLNLTDLAANERPFDIIFVDPPYQLRLLKTLLPMLEKFSPKFIYLEDNQIIDENLFDQFGLVDYQLFRLKKAGQVYYALLKHTSSAKM